MIFFGYLIGYAFLLFIKKIQSYQLLTYSSFPSIKTCTKSRRANVGIYVEYLSSSIRLSPLFAEPDKPKSGIYEYKGTGPPPMFAKLLGLNKSSKDKKTKRRKPSVKFDSSTKHNKDISIAQGNNDQSIDELEKLVMSRFGSTKLSAEDDFDDDEEDENLNKKTRFARSDSAQNDHISKVNSSINSKSGYDSTDSKSRRDNVDSSLENLPKLKPKMVKNIDIHLSPSQQLSRKKLIDRILSKSSQTLEDVLDNNDNDINNYYDKVEDEKEKDSINRPRQSNSSLDEVYDYDMDDEFRDYYTPVPKQEDSKESDNVNYRFRKPTQQTLQNEVIKEAEKEAKTKAKEVQKQEKYANMKIKAKEEFKTDFYVFDFTSDDKTDLTDESNRDETIFSDKTFEDLSITNKQLLQNIESIGIFHPTKIQEKFIPTLLNSHAGSTFYTVMQAMTGSGKTLAFLIPLIRAVNPDFDKVQAIILAPSRELVTQIADVSVKLFDGLNIRTLPIIGGANVRNQVKRLKEEKPHIIVATPGRIAELAFGLQKLGFGMVRAIIVDEIDNMLDEPFVSELETILQAMPVFTRINPNHLRPSSTITPSEVAREVLDDEIVDDSIDIEPVLEEGKGLRYACFASATGTNPNVKKFTEKLSKTPWQMISMDSTTAISNTDDLETPLNQNNFKLPSTITHGIISTPRIRALEYLKRFLNTKPIVKSALIFVNDPYRVETLCEQLLEMGMIAAPLHGDTSKDDRKEIITRLRDGRVNLVVTTELAARGIDIPNLTHVINFELPTDSLHYVHRAGRCGRAGREGLVMNFVNPNTKFVVRRFGKQLRIKIRDCEIREGKVYLRS